VLDGLGRPIDGRPLDLATERVPARSVVPPPLSRSPVSEVLPLGVKAIDTLLTCGRGQRLGLFAGSGVGKSTLLAMLARGTAAELSVVALVGERGREAEEFVREHLGDGLARSVVVIATSDQPALVRLHAAAVATRIAEWFRDQGHDVLLLLDSLTRFAMAQREVGLAAGEPPATRGYPPSTFSLMAGLLERAGTSEKGSITGLYTVLVEGDDLDEPGADAARAILDGHIVLSRALATSGHYPAIDVLASVSRLAHGLHSPDQVRLATEARALLGAYAEAKDLIEVGAYQAGSSPGVDRAIAARDGLRGALTQGSDQVVAPGTSWAELDEAVGS
ncbi:MAG: FliI/YscN family ATPase, partial [Acidimicrobiales bacterium]